jgi:hypothetical protein
MFSITEHAFHTVLIEDCNLQYQDTESLNLSILLLIALLFIFSIVVTYTTRDSKTLQLTTHKRTAHKCSIQYIGVKC